MFGIFGNKKTKQKKPAAILPAENFDVLPNVRTFQKDVERMQKMGGETLDTSLKKTVDKKPAIEKKKPREDELPKKETPADPPKQDKSVPKRETLSPDSARSKIEKDLKEARERWEKRHISTGSSKRSEPRKEKAPASTEGYAKKEPDKKPQGASPVKTFRSDVASAIKDQEQSVARIAIAEQKKRVSGVQKEKLFEGGAYSGKKIAMGVAGFALVVLAGTGGWFLFSKQQTGEIQTGGEIAASPATRSIITPDRQIVIDATDTPAPILKERILSEITQSSEINELREIVLSEIAPSDTEHGRVATDFFLSIWAQNIPERLRRNLSDRFSFGTYFLTNRQIFIALESANFEQALAGMLEWEKTLPSDLASLSGTSMTYEGKFKDAIIDGKDVRVLKDASGKIVLAYLVPKGGVIAITTGRESMEILLERGFNM